MGDRWVKFKRYFGKELKSTTKTVLKDSFLAAFAYILACAIVEFVFRKAPMIVYTYSTMVLLVSMFLIAAILVILLDKVNKSFMLWLLATTYYIMVFIIVNISGGLTSPFICLYTLTMFGVFIISNKWTPIISFLAFMAILLFANYFVGQRIALDIVSNPLYRIKCGIVVFFSIVVFAVVEFIGRKTAAKDSEVNVAKTTASNTTD